MLVRAYDTATGTLAWQDQAPLASGIITRVFIDDLGHKVFAAGYFGTDFVVRAYDASERTSRQNRDCRRFSELAEPSQRGSRQWESDQALLTTFIRDQRRQLPVSGMLTLARRLKAA
jgi:hypothetical protein